jgi:hypothetical protein
MPDSLDRRSFLKTASAGLGAGLVAPALASAAPAIRLQPGAAADRVRVAIMGVNSRGAQLTRAFLNTPGAAITAICDVDTRAAARAIELVSEAGGGRPPSPTCARSSNRRTSTRWSSRRPITGTHRRPSSH